jgi:hypothetical protein
MYSHGQGGQGGRADPTCSQIPLADDRWKLAFDLGFQDRADRMQNHLFSLTANRPMRSLAVGQQFGNARNFVRRCTQTQPGSTDRRSTSLAARSAPRTRLDPGCWTRSTTSSTVVEAAQNICVHLRSSAAKNPCLLVWSASADHRSRIACPHPPDQCQTRRDKCCPKGHM